MITVYYDGKCGLCSKEIQYYQRISPKDRFIWLDIASQPHHLDKVHLTQEQALRRLHVNSPKAGLVQGVEAFCVIWRELPAWRWLALLVSLPVIKQLATIAYNQFADYRFGKLAHCQIASKA